MVGRRRTQLVNVVAKKGGFFKFMAKALPIFSAVTAFIPGLNLLSIGLTVASAANQIVVATNNKKATSKKENNIPIDDSDIRMKKKNDDYVVPTDESTNTEQDSDSEQIPCAIKNDELFTFIITIILGLSGISLHLGEHPQYGIANVPPSRSSHPSCLYLPLLEDGLHLLAISMGLVRPNGSPIQDA